MKDQCIQWTNSLDFIPEVTYPDIFNYLFLTKSAYTLDEFKAFKSLEVYHFFASRWIYNTKWYAVNYVVLVVAEVKVFF
jgi:hypothetical protein